MSITADLKRELMRKYQTHEKDTGSPEIQISLLTQRINDLTGHFKLHKKDHNSRRGLLKLVAKRRHFLDYLQKKNSERYKAIIDKLSLRK